MLALRFREINLHWHDLRHEYASRLVERGVPLAQVRDLLGHASITTTERYDNQKLENLQAAAGRLESGKSFDGATEARTKFQESFKNQRLEVALTDRDQLDEAVPNLLKDEDLKNWLGGRDSCPLATRRRPRRGAPGDVPSSQRASAASKVGWEAGIRTPITWSRATCPTVERPPSARPEIPEGQEPLILARSSSAGQGARQSTEKASKSKKDSGPARTTRGAATKQDARIAARSAYLLVVAAARPLGGEPRPIGAIRRTRVRRRAVASLFRPHFRAPTMARHTTLAAGITRFLAGPLVGRALLMGCLAALAGNLALLHAVHRSETTILFSHTDLLPQSTLKDPLLPAARRIRVRRVWLQRRCHGS